MYHYILYLYVLIKQCMHIMHYTPLTLNNQCSLQQECVYVVYIRLI